MDEWRHSYDWTLNESREGKEKSAQNILPFVIIITYYYYYYYHYKITYWLARHISAQVEVF